MRTCPRIAIDVVRLLRRRGAKLRCGAWIRRPHPATRRGRVPGHMVGSTMLCGGHAVANVDRLSTFLHGPGNWVASISLGNGNYAYLGDRFRTEGAARGAVMSYLRCLRRRMRGVR